MSHSTFLGGGDIHRGLPVKNNMRENKNVSYEAHLCPIIVKAQRAPNAQATLQIVDRHYEELKSSRPDSQTLNSLSAMDGRNRPLKN
jgi:hypothetical protein